METKTLKRTTVFLDPDDLQGLFRVALEESRKAGRRVTVAEIIRQAVKARVRSKRKK